MADPADASEHRELVRRLALRVRAQLDVQVELEDLVAYGYRGLLEAEQRFDPSRGIKFETFAHYRIRGAIIDGIRKMAFLPVRAYRRLKALEAADQIAEPIGEARAAAPEARQDVEKTTEDLGHALGRMTASFVIASLGQSEEEHAPASAEERLLHREAAVRLRAALEKLPEREGILVRAFYFEGRQFDEVAKELGISKSWASRLHTRALDLLREAMTDPE